MSEPICAPATALLPSAVAVVRVSGPGLGERLAPLLKLPQPRRAALRRLRWGGYDERALVLFFPGPSSYTGEDLVEFQLHGNPLLVRRFLEHLATLGIRLAEPGEFTRRSLLNGKQGLLEAEALRDLIGAATDQQLRQAQARAVLPPWIAEAKIRLAPWMARAEAAVDYGEEEGIELDHGALKEDLRNLAAMFHVERRRAEAARWLRDGIRIALAGRPNAGKSTLFNALAGEDRAIVTEIPGTTRDVLELRTEWRGLPLLLFDTAGLRDTEDPVERLGVARVQGVLEQADLILHLVPVTDPGPEPALLAVLAPFEGRVLELRTFADQAPSIGTTTPAISALSGDLDALEAALKQRFLGDQAPEAVLGALATARQRELLEELVLQTELMAQLGPGSPPELFASALQGAWGLLQRLTGEDRAESALDQVFGGFCLGK
ncbi:MAG TPA: tRNA modification GTPase [Holophagaceae bacterium]|nr:tRNA modification GTPase [Holophagaceae bacterium]